MPLAVLWVTYVALENSKKEIIMVECYFINKIIPIFLSFLKW
jgi:hypothetical protein